MTTRYPDVDVKRPLSDQEVEAMGNIAGSVALLQNRRKRKKVLRRAREKARRVELGLKAKGK
jgi:hypothetical protein